MRQHDDLSELMDLARRKDPSFDELWFARALTQLERVSPRAVDMLVPLDFGRMREEFLDAAARLTRRAIDRGLDR